MNLHGVVSKVRPSLLTCLNPSKPSNETPVKSNRLDTSVLMHVESDAEIMSRYVPVATVTEDSQGFTEQVSG